MCGRTACNLDPDEVVKRCRFRGQNGKMQTPRWRNNSIGNYQPSCNVAPQSHTPVIISSKHARRKTSIKQSDENDVEPQERTLQSMRWGLVPSWYKGDSKDFSLSTNNARSDSIMAKASYKNPIMQGKRCVVLAEGFYEWKTSKDGKKQPYYIYFKTQEQNLDTKDDYQGDSTECSGNKRLLTMAGVFDCWKPVKGAVEEDDSLYSYSIITVDASSTFSAIHHRMPWVVIVSKGDYGGGTLCGDLLIQAILDGDEAVRLWLDYESVPHQKALKLLKPVQDCLDWHPVTPRMNNSRYKDEDCTKLIDLSEKKPAMKGGLMSWLVKSDKKEKTTEDISIKTDQQNENESRKKEKQDIDSSESPAKRQKLK